MALQKAQLKGFLPSWTVAVWTNLWSFWASSPITIEVLLLFMNYSSLLSHIISFAKLYSHLDNKILLSFINWQPILMTIQRSVFSQLIFCLKYFIEFFSIHKLLKPQKLQIIHSKGFFFSWTDSVCFNSFALPVNLTLQMVQLNGFFPPCITIKCFHEP